MKTIEYYSYKSHLKVTASISKSFPDGDRYYIKLDSPDYIGSYQFKDKVKANNFYKKLKKLHPDLDRLPF